MSTPRAEFLDVQSSFVIYDDESDEKTAARLYEKLIVEDKVDALLGPYGTAITEAVAESPKGTDK